MNQSTWIVNVLAFMLHTIVNLRLINGFYSREFIKIFVQRSENPSEAPFFFANGVKNTLKQL